MSSPTTRDAIDRFFFDTDVASPAEVARATGVPVDAVSSVLESLTRGSLPMFARRERAGVVVFEVVDN